MLHAVRRAVVLPALLVAVPAVATAQMGEPYSLSTFAGCSVYFCVDYTQTFSRRVYPAGLGVPTEYNVRVDGTLTLRQAALDAGLTSTGGDGLLWASPLSYDWDPGIAAIFPVRSFVGRLAGDQLAFFASGQGRYTTNFGRLELWTTSGVPGGLRVDTWVAMTSNVSLVAPEPSTWLLMGTGLLAIGSVAARRKRAV